MSETLYPSSTGALAEVHKQLAPEQHDAFQTFSRKVFADGALATKTKQLIAVAPRHAVPLLHSRSHQSGYTRGCDTQRADGSDMGRSRDARRCCVCTLGPVPGRNGKGTISLMPYRHRMTLVDESSARSHVRTMTCKVAFHLRLPPAGTDAAGM